MLHAKIMTVDGIVANIGSANLNARSTQLDEEINVVALDPELVRMLDAHFDDDLERSVRIRAAAGNAARWRSASPSTSSPRCDAGSSEGEYRLRGDGDRYPADSGARRTRRARVPAHHGRALRRARAAR